MRIFQHKDKAEAYAKKMNAGARAFRYEVKPYLTDSGKVQGWKVRKLRK